MMNILTLLILPCLVRAQEQNLVLLKDVRKEASFLIPYTPQQRVSVAQDIVKIMDVSIIRNKGAEKLKF
jgi:hypothetical protein